MFEKIESHTNIDSQDMIWLAEYKEDGYLTEFDLKTKKSNSFYDIDQDRVKRFGLVGSGHKIWFEKDEGSFHVSGREYDVGYKIDGTLHLLTKQELHNRDIITYKQAISEVNGTSAESRIVGYYVGYKLEFKADDINFNFKPIISVPVSQAMYVDIHLVADKKLDGKLVIIKNGEIIDELDAPLEKDVAGGLQWKLV